MHQEITDEQLLRYARHIILDEVGEEGQLKLLNSKVLVVGAGGLGSPVLLYLAAAGVGTLGIVDFDSVDISNLQRQILHATAQVGASKVDSAIKAIAQKAVERKTGARGLRAVMEETMLDIMFELPSQKDVEEVVINEEVVAKGEKPMMVYAKKKQAS